MKGKKRALWMMMLLAALWLLLPGADAQAAGGKVRVLTVTRGDYGGRDDLTPGPENDGKNFRRMLEEAYGTDDIVKTVTKEKEGVTTVAGVANAITEAFGAAEDGDVNYFYYSGHGNKQGLNLQYETMTAKDLADGFTGIRGTNILVMDCCYSGGMASRSTLAGNAGGAFIDSFVEDFQEAVTPTGLRPRSALTNSRFKLLMASSAEELSWQMGFGDVELGACTATLAYGCGIRSEQLNEAVGYRMDVVSADYDLNGEVSLSEIRRYIENTYHYTANHVRTYPAEDSSCFLPAAGRVPKIAVNRAYTEEEGGAEKLRVFFYSSEETVIDYAIYQADTSKLGILGCVDLYYGEKLPDYANITRKAQKTGMTLSAFPEQGVLTIPIDGYEDGMYYLIVQTEGQELRYMLPFTVASNIDAGLREKFQMKFSGEYYKEASFAVDEGREMLIRADFGTTANPEQPTPYLTCRIYDGEGGFVRSLGENEVMQVIPVTYKNNSNVMQLGNCYRDFYWDGKDSNGVLVPDGTYLVRVLASGASVFDEYQSLIVRRQAETAEVTELTVSPEEIQLPKTESTLMPEIVLCVNVRGTVDMKVLRVNADGEEAVRTLLKSQAIEGGKRYVISWDGIVDGPSVATPGRYVIQVALQPEGGLAAVVKESAEIVVLEERTEPDTETPGTETPDTETPDTETPGTETPDTETPGTETPGTETPDTETPDTENPDTETAGTETPDTETPGTETPGTETPDTETPDTETPDTEIPDTETPDTERNPVGKVLPEKVVLNVGTKAVQKITMGMKEKVQLSAVVFPVSDENGKLSWTSGNTKVVTVTSTGKITAKKNGKAVIRVTTENGKTASVTITVKTAPKKILLTAKNRMLKAGKTGKVKVKFQGKAASYKVTFTSSKKKVATVDASGKILARKKGRTVITAKTFNGRKAKIILTVR